jgi:predicted ATPase
MQALVERIAEIGTRFDHPSSMNIALTFLGWIKGEQGYPIDGIELTRQGIDFFRRLKMTPFYTCHLATLTELYLQVGDLAAAEAAIDEALTVSEARDERLWDAELFRLRGHILQAQGAPANVVELAYQQALMVAREQQARSLELRAAMSLARLWLGQEQPQRAFQLLSVIYDWFTEGLDTPDLVEARQLLRLVAG